MLKSSKLPWNWRIIFFQKRIWTFGSFFLRHHSPFPRKCWRRVPCPPTRSTCLVSSDVNGEGPELVFCPHLCRPSLPLRIRKIWDWGKKSLSKGGSPLSALPHLCPDIKTPCIRQSDCYFMEPPSQGLKPAFGVSWNSRGQSPQKTHITYQGKCCCSPFLYRIGEITSEIYCHVRYLSISGKLSHIVINGSSADDDRLTPHVTPLQLSNHFLTPRR